jgi:hypothetical protein
LRLQAQRACSPFAAVSVDSDARVEQIVVPEGTHGGRRWSWQSAVLGRSSRLASMSPWSTPGRIARRYTSPETTAFL